MKELPKIIENSLHKKTPERPSRRKWISGPLGAYSMSYIPGNPLFSGQASLLDYCHGRHELATIQGFDVGEEIYQLISKMLSLQPLDRPGAQLIQEFLTSPITSSSVMAFRREIFFRKTQVQTETTMLAVTEFVELPSVAPNVPQTEGLHRRVIARLEIRLKVFRGSRGVRRGGAETQ